MKAKNSDSVLNPTAIEAICELHFTSSENPESQWDGKWFGRLHSALGIDYEMEPKTAKGVLVQATMGKATMSDNLISFNHMLYKHRSKNQLIQLAPWLLAINEIDDYPGWTPFLKHIEHGWKSLSTIIDPINLTRIGMRYINRIPRGSAEETVGDWINKNDIFPKRILSQFKDFFLRCELPLSENTRIIVTVTEEQIDSPVKSIIYDIDTIMTKKHSGEWREIEKSLNLLHEYIRKEFDSSKTNKLNNYLNKQK